MLGGATAHVFANASECLQSDVRVAQIRHQLCDLAQRTVLPRMSIFPGLGRRQSQRSASFLEMLTRLVDCHAPLPRWMTAQSKGGLNLFAKDSLQSFDCAVIQRGS